MACNDYKCKYECQQVGKLWQWVEISNDCDQGEDCECPDPESKEVGDACKDVCKNAGKGATYTIEYFCGDSNGNGD